MSSNVFPKEMIFDKKLNEEELELLSRAYQKILKVDKIEMDSNQYQLYLDKNKKVFLPKGTLVYGTYASLDNLVRISSNGILADELFGKYKEDGLYYSVSFDKMVNDTYLSYYDKEVEVRDNMPFNTNNNTIAFVVNPTSKIGGILYYDLLDSKFDNNPLVRNIIDYEESSEKAAILGGIPVNAISGIILGDKVVINEKLVNKIKKLFPYAYLVTRDGKIIRDRSNIIKIEDYEDISYKYAKEAVVNTTSLSEIDKIKEENNNLKKTLEVYVNATKDIATPFQQAKIMIKLGYKTLPKALRSKLSEEEYNRLKIKE